MGCIDTRDDRYNNMIIEETNIHLDKYDMYIIKFLQRNGTQKSIRVFCEKGTFPKFDSKKYLEFVQEHGEEKIKEFFGRGLDKNGLMLEQRRDDFIYLGGDFDKNGIVGTCDMMQPNGNTGLRNFNANLFSLKLNVRFQEISNSSGQAMSKRNVKYKGKHYVMSDIHGMYDVYMEAMKKLKKEDYVYILGDVIDRGDEGIRIIEDIMARCANPRNNPKITFLLGNHEMQFLDCIDIIVNNNISASQLRIILERMKMQIEMQRAYETKDRDMYLHCQQRYKECNAIYEQQVASKEISDYDLGYLKTWIIYNKGESTIWDYIKRIKSSKYKTDIYTFLNDAYVVLPQKIKGEDYLLVHAMPPKRRSMLRRMIDKKVGYRYSELEKEDAKFMLEERRNETYEKARELGFTTICGHTPQYGGIKIDVDKGFINIDTGCGHNLRRSKLALYCIEDKTVEYVIPRESIK